MSSSEPSLEFPSNPNEDPPVPQRQLITQRSSQTGDTLHVAGALALYPTLDVIVIHVGTLGSADGLLNFYRQATDPAYPDAAISPDSVTVDQRVKVVYASTETVAIALHTILSHPTDITTMERQITEVLDVATLESGILSFGTSGAGGTPAVLEQIQTIDVFRSKYLAIEYDHLGNLGKTTLFIAEEFKKAQTADEQISLYTKIAKKLTARDLASADIVKGTSGLPKFGEQTLPDATPNQGTVGQKAVVLLWARYTGTNTAIAHNPEGDSCVQGQRQLNDLLTGLGHDVITIGHGPRGSFPFKAQYDVGEFYKRAPITSDRATQQSFFLALMERYPGRLYQIGQKTGGMDGAALLGIPTIYLECRGSFAIKRMEKWSNGTVPFYRSVIVDEPAPAIARLLTGRAVPDTKAPFREWKISSESVNRARARLAAMIFAFPTQMGIDDQFPRKALPSKPLSVETEEQEKLWRNRKVKEQESERFTNIVEWARKLPDADLQEDENDPAADGMWTKRVQSTNQADLGQDATGYSNNDLARIRDAVQKVIREYSETGAVILRTAGGEYRTRSDANLI